MEKKNQNWVKKGRKPEASERREEGDRENIWRIM